MEGLVKGDVVVLPFPFSDLSQAKRRPALVLAVLPGDDVILCQITSVANGDPDGISLIQTELAEGKLAHPSVIRPTRMFTAAKQIILYRAARLSVAKLDQVISAAVAILRR